jgi:hypothetical protein
VSRDGRILARGRVYPDIMFATVMTEVTALLTQVFFQLATLHR